MKSKISSWAIAFGAVLGIAFLSGAFAKLLKWDEDQTKLAGGVFTLGAGLVGSMLAHKAGIIDGDAKNLVIGASVAVGTYQAIGHKATEMGSRLVAGMRGEKSGSSSKKKTPDAFEPDVDRDRFSDGGELDFDLPPVRGAGLINGGINTTAPALPAAGGGNTTIIHQAPKIQAPNPWVGLVGDVLKFGGGLATGLMGSAGSNNRRGPMSLAHVVQ